MRLFQAIFRTSGIAGYAMLSLVVLRRRLHYALSQTFPKVRNRVQVRSSHQLIKPGISTIITTLIALVLSSPATFAGTDKTQSQVKENLSKSRADLVKATDEYKQSLQKIIELTEKNLNDANVKLARLKELFAQGVITKRELDEGQSQIAAIEASVNQSKKQLAEADDLLAEASALDQLTNAPALPKGKIAIPTLITTPAYLRFNGTAHWTLAETATVSNFFVGRFGHQLPISAYGQTATHDHLGFDHRNSVDVAVHPDSTEGQALLAFLQSAGIPFMAFRHAISGSATGAHIHIGYPSHRY